MNPMPSLPIPKSVRQFIQSFSMTLGGGFPALGFMDKVKDEHITQFFDHVEEESKREAADRKSHTGLPRTYSQFWRFLALLLFS